MLTNTTGVILAGGKSTRMGGEDKGLIVICGQPLVTYVIRALESQVETILVSANRNQLQYNIFGSNVIEDSTDKSYGPLSGILSAMQYAKTEYILTAPCDSPLLPLDYAKRMYATLNNHMSRNKENICVAHDGDQIQPVFSLISCKLVSSLKEYITAGYRKTADWVMQQNPMIADFSGCDNMFFNMNTPEDKTQLERLMSTDYSASMD